MGSPVNAALEVDSNSPFWNDPIGKLTKAALEGNTEALSMAIALWMDFSTTSGDVAANTQGVKNIVMGL